MEYNFEYLKKCNFHIKNVVFKNSFAIDLDGQEISNFLPILFSNCTFQDFVDFSNISEDKLEIGFENCTINLGKSIAFNNVIISSIRFYQCEILNLKIEDSKIMEIVLENSTIESSFRIDAVECESVLINQGKKESSNHRNHICSFQIDGSKLGTLDISNEGIIGFLRIGAQIDEFSLINQGQVDMLVLDYANRATIYGNIGQVDIYADNFKRIEFDSWTNNETTEIVRAKIDRFYYREIQFEGTLILEELEIKELQFSGLSTATGVIQLNEVAIEDAMFRDCSISKFYWNQVKFINSPEIIRSDLSSLQMSNVFWGNDKRLKNSFLDERIPLLYYWRQGKFEKEDTQYINIELSELKYQRDTYRQLKAASIANHNTIESLEFYKNEMILYWKEIRLEGGVAWHDRVLVFVNRFSSNFGQNWWMPLCWMFGFAFLFYSCILNWNYFGNDWSGSKEFGQFWVLFNPVHSTPKYINSGMGHFTEFIMRVVTGYFLYHFIRASRKFGR